MTQAFGLGMKWYMAQRWLGQMRAAIAGQCRFQPMGSPWSLNTIVKDRETKQLIELHIRSNADWISFIQIFYDEDYSLSRIGRGLQEQKYLGRIRSAGLRPLIVDCGANVGMATRYFSQVYPDAYIVAIEPDAANVSAWKANCYGLQAEIRTAAIGAEAGRCSIADIGAESNAFRVESDQRGSIPIITIDEILNDFRNRGFAPFLVKIDIEGFEEQLFSRSFEWVQQFQVLVAEIHDWMLPGKGTSRNLLKAVSSFDRDFLFRNENVFSMSNDV